MKIVKKLIQLHKYLFLGAMLFIILSVGLNLYWNSFLADILDTLERSCSFDFGKVENSVSGLLAMAGLIIIFCTISDYFASYLASYTCEVFAHEMRVGYAGFYLQSDFYTLSRLNVGEEQSAMQNELQEISTYLNENLFVLTKDFIGFIATVIFLLYQNCKLAIFSIVPVIPLIIYCSFSSRVIKNYTGKCQESKQQLNGVYDTFLELFPVIQVYEAYRLMKRAIYDRLVEYQNLSIGRERVSAGLMSLSGVFSFLPLLLLLGVGGYMVIKGEISIGIFYIFINLSGNVSGFLQNMPKIYAGFRKFGASVGRVETKVVLRDV